jgi:hypothetical protein
MRPAGRLPPDLAATKRTFPPRIAARRSQGDDLVTGRSSGDGAGSVLSDQMLVSTGVTSKPFHGVLYFRE